MRRLLLTLVALGVVIAGAQPVAAANQPELQVDELSVSQYPDATATVTAPRELVGRDLTKGAFTVTQGGGERPLTVTSVPTDDLEIVLVIDTSGSMRDSMQAAKDAATRFVDQLPVGVRAAVLGFGTEPVVAQPFTDDKAALTAAIADLEAAGETALYDAVGAALEQFPPETEARRSIVLLSDGGDTVSSANLDEATEQLGASDVTLYAVELESSESDPESLQRLADVTEGRVASADDPDALGGVYDEILSQLVNRYTLAFTVEGEGRSPVRFNLAHDGVTRTVTKVVELPIIPEVTLPDEPATVRILSTDTEDYPNVELRVIAPRQLSEEELESEAFTITERGRVQAAEVTRIDSVDLEVVLMIDTSGSMAGEPLRVAKRAALHFLRQLPADTRVAVQTFAEEPQTVAPLSADVAAAEKAIGELTTDGETALYDAVDAATALFSHRDGTARTVVLFSDGGDTVSGTSFLQASATLAQENVNLQVVQIESPETDAAGLRRFAEPVGGVITVATDESALEAAYDSIAADVANQYIVRYVSSANGPTQVRVTVEAEDVRADAVRNLQLPAAGLVSGVFASRMGLIIGLSLCYLAMAIIVLTLLIPGERRAQIAGAARKMTPRRTGLAELASRATALADQTLANHGWTGPLNAVLEQAGVNLRPGEFVVLVVSAMIAGMCVGWLFGGPLLAVVAILVIGLIAKLGLSFLRDRRRRRFADQLADTLQLLSGSLRAGYGIMQALDSVSREADDPTADEFRRLLMETRLGRDLNDALTAMAGRVGNEDFQWVVQAMEIHREIGGDLAEVLETVAGTIRERDQIRRQIKALSAEGRLSAYILLALPFGVGFLIYLSSPDYIGELTNGGLFGWALIGTGILLMSIGAFWLKKITKLVF